MTKTETTVLGMESGYVASNLKSRHKITYHQELVILY